MIDLGRLLKDAVALNSAGDPDACANPPRNLRQFRLGWLSSSNWFRHKYERDAQITVISIDRDRSSVQGGLDPFNKSSLSSIPFLTAMSPNGDIFAVANSDGRLDIRLAETGEQNGEALHCEHQRGSHNVVWMYFLDESTLVTEYECGSIHKHRLGGHPSLDDQEIIHSLSRTQSSSNIFSTCSLDRSTIFRFTKSGHDNAVKGEEHFDGVVVHPGEVLSAAFLDCRCWTNPPLRMPSMNVFEGWILGPWSLAISRDNQYAAVAFIERDGRQHDACRRVHLWSIKESTYLGFRDTRGPKWELWVPANHFGGSCGHDFLVQRPIDAKEPLKVGLIVDVHPPKDTRAPKNKEADWIYFVVHGGQTRRMHYSASAFTFAFSLVDKESHPGEFLYKVDMTSCGALALCIRDIIRDEATCHTVFLGRFGLYQIGTLDQYSGTAAIAASHAVRINAVDAARRAADLIRFPSRVYSFGSASAMPTAAHRHAAANAAAAAGNVTVASLACDVAALYVKANRPDGPNNTFGSRSVGIQCTGISKSRETVQLPQHLVLPLLLNRQTGFNFHSRFGGSRAVLGGYAHPFDPDKWIPVCVLDFTNLPISPQSDGPAK